MTSERVVPARTVVPALVTAAGVVLLTFLSFAVGNVVGVVGSMGRYPEAMLDYALPALGSVAEYRGIPLVGFALAVVVGMLLFARRVRTVPSAVLAGLLIAVIGTVLAAAVALTRTGMQFERVEGMRILAQGLVATAAGVGDIFITAAPLTVLGAVLLVSWQRSRGLTERTVVE